MAVIAELSPDAAGICMTAKLGNSMKRTVKPFIFTTMLGFSASMAQAITVADVVQTYQDAAYSGIEVKESPNQIKVEGIKDGVKVEVVYDKTTGDVIKRESEAVDAGEISNGLEVSVTDHDFTDDNVAADDNSASDDNDAADDNSASDDNDAADDNSSDVAPDHDAGDDNGGSGHDDGGHDDGGHDDGGHDGSDD